MTASKPGGDRSYKRRWKNLLINKRYQLRFTLFMVGLASLLMVGLGIWVMRVANETTMVSMASVRGEACPKVPSLGDGAARREDDEPAPVPSMKLEEAPDGPAGDSPSAAAAAVEPPPPAPAPSPDIKAASPGPASAATDGKDGTASKPDPATAPTPGSTAAAPPPDTPTPATPPGPAGNTPGAATTAGNAGAPGAATTGSAGTPGAATDDEPRHVKVQIDESSMTLTHAVPVDLADRVAARWTCELRQAATFDRLERGRKRILWAMIATGILLVLGLAAYGIKMTHRVAGPLFKVSLYLSKMRAGRFDKVYNLRKGDQLVEFYDHFKQAHGGIVAMQRDDIARIAAVIAAAEASGASQHPAVVELRALLERKEKSVE